MNGYVITVKASGELGASAEDGCWTGLCRSSGHSQCFPSQPSTSQVLTCAVVSTALAASPREQLCGAEIPPLWFAAWRALSAQPSVSMRHPNSSTFGSRAPRPQERQLSIKNCFHVFLYPVTDKSTEVFSTAVTRREKCSEQQSNRSAFTVNWAWKISASLMCWSHTNLHTTGGRDEAMAREFGENFIFHWGQQVFLTCNGNQLAKEQVPWN